MKQNDADVSADWTRARNSLKTRWVAAVMAFWVSVAVLAIVFFIDGRLDPILVSIALGLLVVGIWLKINTERICAETRKDLETCLASLTSGVRWLMCIIVITRSTMPCSALRRSD